MIVSDLTDLDICKRIAEIEGVELMPFRDGDRTAFAAGSQTIYSPLTDDALCFRLMIIHEITLKYDYKSCANRYVCFSGNFVNGFKVPLSRNENPNRAICLAIIESKK